MAKVKMTKGELKRQRDILEQFRRYLPTLQLKKQQLQMRIFEVQHLRDRKQQELEGLVSGIRRWVGLLADPGVDVKPWIIPSEIKTHEANIAGVDVPVFDQAVFKEADYDLYIMPFWLDRGITELRRWASALLEVRVIEKQIEILQQELRITTQRVNLFEKIKIPESIENIRKIRIALGDRQANAVGISKVAKKKIEMAGII